MTDLAYQSSISMESKKEGIRGRSAVVVFLPLKVEITSEFGVHEVGDEASAVDSRW